MKKAWRIITTCLLFLTPVLALEWVPRPQWNEDILTTSDTDVLDTTDINDNPFRQWAAEIIDGVDGTNMIEWDDIIRPDGDLSFDNSFQKTLDIIKTTVNYVLWLLALVTLIYLVIQGILALVHQWDEAHKKALQGLKIALLVIAGLALSRFLVSFIFRIIDLIIN